MPCTLEGRPGPGGASGAVKPRTGAGDRQRTAMTELPNVHVRAEILAQALPHMQRYDQEIGGP